MNGVGGYTIFVQVHDLGQPGSNDYFSVWIYDLFGVQVYTSGGLLSGGNIRIHETAAGGATSEWACDNDGDTYYVNYGFSCTPPVLNSPYPGASYGNDLSVLEGEGYDIDDNNPQEQ